MSFQKMPVSPLTPERRAMMQARVRRFVDDWHTHFYRVEKVCRPHGEGGMEDICSLDYAIYEGLWAQYAEGQTDMFFLGACMLGQVLEKRLQMRWCEIGLSDGPRLALVSDYNGMVVPIQEMICHRLSADPQFGGFEHVYFDVYLSRHFWPLGSHPLQDCTLLLDDGEFERVYGYEVPEDIQRQVMLLGLQDEHHWVRTAGLDAYEYADRRDWAGLRRQLGWIVGEFRERYGDDWEQRIERQNPNIFEDWPR